MTETLLARSRDTDTRSTSRASSYRSEEVTGGSNTPPESHNLPPAQAAQGRAGIAPAAATAITYGPSYPKISRKITITATAGAAVVPHMFSTEPSTFMMGAMFANPGPAAGVTGVYLDTTAPHTTGFDETNLYLFVVGTGTFECYVG